MNNGIETPQPGGTIFRELKRVAGLGTSKQEAISGELHPAGNQIYIFMSLLVPSR